MSQKGHILYVEDNDDTRLMLELLLKREGFNVTSVSTASECITEARNHHYDLFLLDHVFPDASGLSLCAQLRKEHQNIPIMFYSGKAFPKEIEAGMNAGADAYLIKPNDILKIPEQALRLIEEYRRRSAN